MDEELLDQELNARILLDVVEAGGPHDGAYTALMKVFRALEKPGRVASFEEWSRAFTAARGEG